jgi:hypothetical protein
MFNWITNALESDNSVDGVNVLSLENNKTAV